MSHKKNHTHWRMIIMASSIWQLKTNYKQMKNLKLFVAGILLFLAVATQAQISVHVNLGIAPQWGPVGYSDVRYYYLPDVEAYYDVPSSMFIYYNGITWVHRSSLPSRYRNYDLYNGYKVVMSDYHGNAPYTGFREHKRQYAKGYRGHEQHNIGERPQRENYQREGNSRRSSNHRVEGNKRQGSDKQNKRSHDEGHGRGKNK